MLPSFQRFCSFLRPIFLATCVLAFGCNSDSERITSSTSKYEVAGGDESAKSGGASDGQASAVRKPAQGTPFDAVNNRSEIAERPTGDRSGTPPQSVQTSAGTSRPATGTGRAGSSAGSVPKKPSSARPASGSGQQPNSNRPEDLLAFINELASREPSGLTPQEYEAEQRQTHETIIRVADQLLGGDADNALRLSAAEAKLTALAGLQQINVPNAGERRDEFCLELKSHSIAELAELGRRASFAFALNEFFEGDLNAKTILKEFRELVAAEKKDARLLEFTGQVASVFEQNGHIDEAIELLGMVVAEYKDSTDKALATDIAGLQEQALLIKTDLRRKFDFMVQRQPGSIEQFLAASKTLLADRKVGSATLRVLLEQAAPVMETLHRESGAELYTLVEQAFRDHPNPETVALVKSSLENFRRRSGLLNQPYSVSGLTLDGERFDWNEYRGKVVLVDFWSTWCDLCLQEMPNIRQNYDLYKEQGFEVVGVNLDSDLQNVERFFSVQRLPWPTVVSANPQQRGMQSPLAVQSGVSYIPFLVLVGRDGKVAALNVTGPDLGPKIAELLRTTSAPQNRGN